MINEFNKFKQLYQENRFFDVLSKKKFIYWLKLRSISRKVLLTDFCNYAHIDCKNIKSKELFAHIYHQQVSDKILDKFI